MAAELRTWRMPLPPPERVLLVRDCVGRVWGREDTDGLLWCNESGAVQHWDWLIYNRAPLTAEEAMIR